MSMTPTISPAPDVQTSLHDILMDARNWSVCEVVKWAENTKRCSHNIIDCLQAEQIDGEVLLSLSETDIYDFRYRLNHQLTFSELKKFWLCVQTLQQHYANNFISSTPQTEAIYLQAAYRPGRNLLTAAPTQFEFSNLNGNTHRTVTACCSRRSASPRPRVSLNTQSLLNLSQSSLQTPECRRTCSSPCAGPYTKNIPPEFFKTLISLGYSFLVTWITSFVMVIVHERVPDMKRYPPLPDIFLDNVPHIPWAFHMCEITGTLLFAIWTCVIFFHKYRTVLLRRFFALAGTVFLLRCVTMLITSLSVPGTHLQCDQTDYAIDDTQEALQTRILRAYIIWSGLGMSIQGVRTCGDYMFSGHTVALTLLNFFITEYTPRNLYFLHTLTWLLNMFGIFFILAAHEHYSIDVFVAFYITSRLFLYYHTLANNQALMSQDSNRTRIWFPMFSYFESSVEGIVPNEFDTIQSIGAGFLHFVLNVKDTCMLTGRRIWLDPPHLPNLPNIPMQAQRILHIARVPGFSNKRINNASTSTTSTITHLMTPNSSLGSSNSLLAAYWNTITMATATQQHKPNDVTEDEMQDVANNIKKLN